MRDKLVTPESIRYHGLDFRWGALSQDVRWDNSTAGFRLDGLQVPRDLLDPVLIQRARELGVKVRENCAARSLLTQGSRICGVATSQGNFLADFVVDAAGARHWLARKLRLPVRFYSPELYGYYGWVEGSCAGRDERPQVATDETGWIFTSRIADGLYQFSRMSFVPLELGADWVPEQFAGMRSVQPTLHTPRQSGRLRGADLTWRRVTQCTGPGYLICGDALARTDPIGQQGVFKSILCGFQLALALNSLYHNGVSEENALKSYSDWAQSSYDQDLLAVRQSYSQHPFAPAWLKDEATIQQRFLEPEKAA